MRHHKERLNRWWLSFSIILAVLLASAAYSLYCLSELRRREKWVVHSNEVMRNLETVSALSSSSLISVRQTISNSDRKISLGDSQRTELNLATKLLVNLVKDNPAHAGRAKRLERITVELQAALADIQAMPTQTLEGLNSLLKIPDDLLSEIHSIVRQMLDEERELLAVRTQQSRSIFRNSLIAQLISTTVAIVAAISTVFLARQRFADQLKVANDRRLHDEQTEFLLNSSSDGICGVDVAGVCTRINQAGAQMLGYEVGELVGKNFHNLVHFKRPDNTPYPHNECPIHHAITSASSVRVEDEVFWHRGGTAIPVSYSAAPWIQHGKAAGAVVSFSDISQRRRNELAVKAAHAEAEEARLAAESANGAKSNFLASMSHELRTPLNAVIMYSEMLQEEADELKLDHFSKDLTRIHTAGRHLLSLVNGVLDIAKIEAGKMELYIEEVPVTRTIQDVVSTAMPLIQKNGNQLVVESNVHGSLSVDVTKFRQIVLNLLSNAAKFTKNGTITLRIDPKESMLGRMIRITVQDTGTGIAPDKLADLFKPFVQAEKSISKEYGGTGLGLTLAKQFAELMQGSIDVQSELNVGTTFTVGLPINVGSYAGSVPDATPDTDHHEVDILIIDDDQNTAEYVAKSLSNDGYATAIASNGKSGLETAVRLRPKLIVLDVLMPEMDGWSVLYELKANSVTSETPVVLLTVANQSELGFALGAHEYLSKPVSREQLISVAHRLGIAHSGRIAMVIDDDPSTRQLLDRLLTKEGWRVIKAEDGSVAIRQLQAGHKPDMILLDLQMPNMDGFDFLDHLRSHGPQLKAPIVVLTSRDLSIDERTWLADRVERILQKGGQTQHSLLETVRAVLRKAPVHQSSTSFRQDTEGN